MKVHAQIHALKPRLGYNGSFNIWAFRRNRPCFFPFVDLRLCIRHSLPPLFPAMAGLECKRTERNFGSHPWFRKTWHIFECSSIRFHLNESDNLEQDIVDFCGTWICISLSERRTCTGEEETQLPKTATCPMSWEYYLNASYPLKSVYCHRFAQDVSPLHRRFLSEMSDVIHLSINFRNVAPYQIFFWWEGADG